MSLGNCVLDANRLMMKDKNKGKVYYVPKIEGKKVGHAFYISPNSKPQDKALNQADNGYPQYDYTVKQVKDNANNSYLTMVAD
jgi:hypothetical protein